MRQTGLERNKKTKKKLSVTEPVGKGIEERGGILVRERERGGRERQRERGEGRDRDRERNH